MEILSIIQKTIKIRRYNESKSFFEFLNNNIIPYVVVKGEPLSFLAYNESGKRISADIDILIPKAHLKLAEQKLKELDFNSDVNNREKHMFMLAYTHQVSPWYKGIKPFGEFSIDLNFDIFWGEYEGKRIDIGEFLSDTIEMEIYGVKVKTLPPLKAMIQLILHHYKDMNSLFLLATRKSIKYDMFKDVYYLLKNNLDTISLDKLYAMSAEYEIIPYVFYVLYYTGQVFDDDVLKQYIEAFRTPEGEALLNCYGLCEKERREWKCDFKTRLDSDHLYELIKENLTERDKEKIAINRRIFLGISE